MFNFNMKMFPYNEIDMCLKKDIFSQRQWCLLLICAKDYKKLIKIEDIESKS